MSEKKISHVDLPTNFSFHSLQYLLFVAEGMKAEGMNLVL